MAENILTLFTGARPSFKAWKVRRGRRRGEALLADDPNKGNSRNLKGVEKRGAQLEKGRRRGVFSWGKSVDPWKQEA